MKPSISDKIKKIVRRESQKFALDYKLVMAIILTESGGNPKAISKKNAQGLMQIMPSTAKQIARNLNIKYDKEIILKPDINICIGCYYLHILLRKFSGDLRSTLAAYNTGPYRVKRLLETYPTYSSKEVIENKTSRETRTFVFRVLERYKDLGRNKTNK